MAFSMDCLLLLLGLIMKRVYDKFVEKSVEGCLSRCRDDLTALTRFVTWDLHERSAGALRRSLPDSSMVQIYSLAVRHGGSGTVVSISLVHMRPLVTSQSKRLHARAGLLGYLQ